MLKLYRKFHFLSLDIVAGALAMSVFAARLLGSRPGWLWYLALAATVWALYTGDHVLDAWRHRKKSQREIHRFIFRVKRPLLYALGIVLIVDLFLVFNFMDKEMLKGGLFLAALVLAYYAMRHILRRQRFLFIPGEAFVLLLYLAGTWLGPWMAKPEAVEAAQSVQPAQWLVLLMTAAVLWINLGVISLYDVGVDSRLGIASLASVLGKKATKSMMLVTAGLVFLLAVLQFMVYDQASVTRFTLILSGMAAVLLLILYYPSYFRKEEAYRLAADAVLYMGFLALLIG
jgi:4-hydroxybenzoate polyprenyltransferase